MDKGNNTNNGIPVFKKGTCACEGGNTFKNARVIKKQDVRVFSQNKGYSRINRSIKSRYIK